MNSVTKDLKKIFKDEHIYSMDDENNPYVIKELISTNCYILNALMCEGDILGGIVKGKRISLAGPSSTGKSLLTAYIAKNYLENVPGAELIAFETEGASFYDMMESIGIDKKRVTILPVNSVEKFRIFVTKILEHIKEEEKSRLNKISLEQKKLNALKKLKTNKEKNADKIQTVQNSIQEIGPKKEYIFLLDSLGMLATNKEINDALSGSTKADMTRAKIIRSIFRIISMDLFTTQTPFLIVNHSYECIDGEQNIIMFDNTIKNVKDINIYDKVKTINGIQKIINTVSHEIDSYIELELEDNKIIKCTPNHKFLINGNWISAIDINKNDELDEL